MIEEKTRELINELISIELENASKNYGKTYHSLHEGYAVLKEEIEEVLEAFADANDEFEIMWGFIRQNKSQKEVKALVEGMLMNLKSVIAEAAQCCAVLNKIKRGI